MRHLIRAIKNIAMGAAFFLFIAVFFTLVLYYPRIFIASLLLFMAWTLGAAFRGDL